MLAFVSLEDHTTLGRRYGLAVGDALFLQPLCMHAGDSYITSNIRVHYYAFKAGTKWKPGITYKLKSSKARDLTYDPQQIRELPQHRILLLQSRSKGSHKMQKAETLKENFKLSKSSKRVVRIVACELVDDCIESVLTEL